MSPYKKFLKKLAVYSLLPLCGVFVLFVIPSGRKYRFQFTHVNCMGQGSLIYEKIYNNHERADIAFLGSSHAICAVNDSLLHTCLNRRGIDLVPANLAYCRYGRNLHYTLCRQLLQNKKVKVIVLEVCATENRTGHPEYGYFADTKDIFNPVWLFNDNLFKDVYDALFVRLYWLREKITGPYEVPANVNRKYGYMNSSQVADTAFLRKTKETADHEQENGLMHQFHNHYLFGYIKRIAALAGENDCALVFLYLPAYGSLRRPEEDSFYMKQGTLLIPPAEILDNPLYWKDKEHMNEAGATELTLWLAKELEDVLPRQSYLPE